MTWVFKWRSLVFINSLVALWIVLTGNLTFFRRLASLTPFQDWRAEIFLLSAVILLWAYVNFALQLLTWGRLARPFLTFILLASAITAYFVDTYGVGIDSGQIQNMLETDVREVMDLASWRMLGYVVVLAGLPIFVLWRRPVLTERFWSRQRARLLSGLTSFILVSIVAVFLFADYASIFRSHREIRFLINPHNYISGLRSKISYSEFEKNLPLLAYGQDAYRQETIVPSNKPIFMVLVVGETARAESFGLNGYVRDTTPELERHQIINFSRVASCGTATAVSLPCMFSGFSRDEYDPVIANRREGLLDILKRVGYQVTWIDNNSGCKGVCDRIVQAPLLRGDRASKYKEGKFYDEALVDSLVDLLKRSPLRDQVVVLHQYGSHGPAYFKAYPEKFRRFKPTCDSNLLQTCTRQEVINSYDNTIAYTDHVLARVIDVLKNEEVRYRTAFWYVSDHGESTGESGLFLHGAPYFFAPRQQTHVPMVAWMSQSFAMSQNMDCIRGRQNQELSHDNLFHSILGILRVKTDVYRADLDIGASC